MSDSKVYKYNGVNKVVKDDNGKEQVIIFCSKGDKLSAKQGERVAKIVCAMTNDYDLIDKVEQLIIQA